MKFFKVSLSLNREGLNTYVSQWEGEEKKEIYKLFRTDSDGEKIVRHLKKDELMKVNSYLLTTPSHIEYNMVCPEESLEEAKSILLERVKSTAFLFKKQIEELNSHLT